MKTATRGTIESQKQRSAEPGWTITEERFDPSLGRAYEGLFTLGSGLLHVRGSLEEHLFDAPQNLEFTRRPTNTTVEKFAEQKAKWGTYNPGVRGNHPLLNRGIVNLPYFLDLTPYAGKVQGSGDSIASEVPCNLEKLDMERSQILEYERTLDMKTAVLRRKVVWKTASGACLKVKFERFVSAAHAGLCMQRMAITPVTEGENQTTRLKIRAGIDGDVRTSGFDMFSHIECKQISENEIQCQVTTNVGNQATMNSQLLTRGFGGQGPGVADKGWRYIPGERGCWLETSVDLPEGETVIVEKRTVVSSSFDPSTDGHPPADGHPPGGMGFEDPSNLTYEEIFQAHARIWEERWKRSDVIIEGDDVSQLAIRASIFHLLRSHPDDPRVAIDPKGYAGDAYRGSYFWDTEIYLLPFYLYTDPRRARALLEYRISTLPGAMENARQTGYRGARYAWEADIDGTETCPNWQYRDHEVHVTADVVYAMAHYAAANNDEAFLEEEASQVILETARYWADRVDWRKGEGYPSLLGVMGPDEYTPISSNNSYTNRLAAFNLLLAAKYGGNVAAPKTAVQPVTKQEQEAFRQIATSLPIPHSRDGMLVLQCEEFERLAEPAFERFWLDRNRPYAAQVPQEWLYRSKCLKQADVLMLMMLFAKEFSDEEVRTAWETYLPYTTHDSSLSAGVHAIVACRLGLDGEAWRFWEMSSLNDLDFGEQSVHSGAAEGVHIAGSGINWQMVVFGFAGMSTALNSEILHLQPRLPKGWKRLSFPISWKRQQAAIEIVANTNLEGADTVKLSNHSSQDLLVEVNGVRTTIPPGKTSTFPGKP